MSESDVCYPMQNCQNPFGGEAMRTAVDLINLSPSVPLDGDIPERVWTDQDVSFKHLRVFGCRTFVHIFKDKRSKLDVKSKQCIFLSYEYKDFGYRLYDPVEKKVTRKIDVIFFENQTIDIYKGDNPKSLDNIPASSNLDPDPIPIPVDFNQGGVETEQREDVDDGDNPAANEPEHEVPPTPSLSGQDELRRSTREKRPSSRYNLYEYVLLTDGGKPESYCEALEHENKEN